MARRGKKYIIRLKIKMPWWNNFIYWSLLAPSSAGITWEVQRIKEKRFAIRGRAFYQEQCL
jgi:hypothetical protein